MSLIANIVMRLIALFFKSRLEAAPSQDAFQAGFDFVMSPDIDGQQNDSAPGEKFRTSWGITQATWDQATEHGIVTGHLEDCTVDQAKAIMRAMYYNAMDCNSLPSACAFVMFCDSVLTGVGHVVRLAQRVSGTQEDGMMGPKTVSAICTMDRAKFVDAFIVADEQYLSTLASYPKYKNGWNRRETATHVRAMELV